MHVRWDEEAQATANGPLVFFAEFLATAGIFDRWLEDCPLSYTRAHAPTQRDVLGTRLLAILAGYQRYAHITLHCVAMRWQGKRWACAESSVKTPCAGRCHAGMSSKAASGCAPH
jgi:hypothetical protein